MYFPIIDALKENYIAKIPSIVTKWLTDNVNPVGSAVVVDESLSISGAAADAKVTGDKISNLKSDFNQLENSLAVVTEETVSEQIPLTWTEGQYISATGQPGSVANLMCSSSIAVQEGDVIQFHRQSDGGNILGYRFIAAYNNGAITSHGGENGSLPYTVPNGVDSIRVTLSLAYGTGSTATNEITSKTIAPILEQKVSALNNIIASKKKNCLEYSFNLASNGTFTSTEEFEDICGYRICLFAKISSFSGEIKIGKGMGVAYGCGIGIDATNLYEYLATAATPSRTQAHGLTFADYISIVIDAHYNQKATLTVNTNGGSYTWEVPYWFSSKGHLSVSSSVALTNCKLSYTCEGITKETWLYGDSYFNNGATDRWTSYLVKGDYKNYLLNGFAGRNSQQAMTSLKVDLSMGRVPRRIVWCLGMNDKDTATAANVNWSEKLEELIGICEQNRIELILATIPNVPSTAAKNDFKNEVVRNSGYRYIDFANAVSADGSSTWYDNMLSSDNVHPDVQGAIALYSCAVAEVPELLL